MRAAAAWSSATISPKPRASAAWAMAVVPPVPVHRTAGPVVRAVGGEAADGDDIRDSVHRELVGHGEQGQRDRQFERARVTAGGQGRISGAGGLEAHVGADLADTEPLQGVGDGGGGLLRFGVADAGDVESSGSVGGGGHREQVSVDAACVRAVDLHWMHFLSDARTGRS